MPAAFRFPIFGGLYDFTLVQEAELVFSANFLGVCDGAQMLVLDLPGEQFFRSSVPVFLQGLFREREEVQQCTFVIIPVAVADGLDVQFGQPFRIDQILA